MFFVLSGYLITSLLFAEFEKTRSISLKNFYIRRVLRLGPALALYLIASLAVTYHSQLISLTRQIWLIVIALLYSTNWRMALGWDSVMDPTSITWSLSIEEQFYLLWPLVMLKIVTGTPRRKLFAAVLWFALWATIFVLLHVGRIMHFYAGLTVGCVLRLAFSDARIAASIRKIFSGRSAIAVGAVLAYIVIFEYRTSFLDPLICGLGLCATLAEPNAWIGRMLEFSGLRWIGRLSYSLYIWQQLFLAFGVVFLPFGIFSRFPVNLATTVAVACLSYYLMERPMMRLGHDIAGGASGLKPIPCAQLETR